MNGDIEVGPVQMTRPLPDGLTPNWAGLAAAITKYLTEQFVKVE